MGIPQNTIRRTRPIPSPRVVLVGKRVEDVDHSPEGSRDFAIRPSKSCQVPTLLLENLHDRFDGITTFELLGERMVDQFQSCLFLIVLQGGVEERLKVRI